MDWFGTSPNRSEPGLNQSGKRIDKKNKKKTALGWICSPSDYCYYTLVHLSGLTLSTGQVLDLETKAITVGQMSLSLDPPTGK